MNFPDAFKEIRKIYGLTQKRLGEMLQITSMGVSHIEAGRRNPSTELIVKLAVKLDIPPSFIYLLADPNAYYAWVKSAKRQMKIISKTIED